MNDVFINVWNCRAFVARRIYLDANTSTFEEAINAGELEDDAIAEVEAQGGAINLSGNYEISDELAARAMFADEVK